MDKKKWLERYQKAKFNAESLWRQATQWYDRVCRPSGLILDGLPKPAGQVDRFEKEVIKSLDLFEQARDATKYADRVRTEIHSVIDRLEDLDQLKILTLKYLEGMSWTQISDYMDMSRSRVYKVYSGALDEIEIKQDKTGQNRTE